MKKHKIIQTTVGNLSVVFFAKQNINTNDFLKDQLNNSCDYTKYNLYNQLIYQPPILSGYNLFTLYLIDIYNIIVGYVIGLFQTDKIKKLTLNIKKIDVHPLYKEKGIHYYLIEQLILHTNNSKYKLLNAGGSTACLCYLKSFLKYGFVPTNKKGKILTQKKICQPNLDSKICMIFILKNKYNL